MEILSLKTENFKGVPLDINFNGADTDIYGDNGTGKTTVADAIWWLLFNKNSLNEAKFDIKPLDPNGNEQHNLEYSVEAKFMLDDEQTVTLKKVMAEKWTQKRGSASKENTGNETKCFIDGTPKSISKFNKYIAEIFTTEEAFKLMTNVHQFTENISWKERREIVLQICGDVENSEVFAANSDVAELANMLSNKSLEDFKATINAEKKKINDELRIIPAKVAELKNSITDTESDSKLKIDAELSCARKELSTINEEMLLAKNGGNVLELKKSITEIDTAILTHKNDLNKDNNDRMTALLKEINGQKMELAKLESDKRDAIYTELGINQEIEHANNDLSALAETFDAEAAEKYPDIPLDDTCALCGQKLPVEQMEVAKQKAEKQRAEYNSKKANRLTALNKKGKELKTCLEKKNAELAECEKETAKLKDTVVKVKNAIYVKEQQYQALLDSKIESSPAIDALEAKKLKYLQQITDAETSTQSNIAGFKEKVDAKQSEINNLESKLAAITAAEKTKNRISELTNQQKDLAKKFEELSRQLFLTEEFTKTRVKLLEDKIADKFKLTSFKMFDNQVNGGIAECCEPMYDGKPYKALNNAMQYNIGLDIIRTLDKFYNFYPPIFIDNAESITKLDTDIDAQIIRLIVSESDKELRVVNKEKVRKEVA